MLSPEKIMSCIAGDKYSSLKRQARIGQRYYNGRHDILDYRVFYIDKNGLFQEDFTKSNIRVPHPFFKEIVEQEVAYILSGGILFKSGYSELEEYLKTYFGNAFLGEIQETLVDVIVNGFGYLYWYRDEKNITRFTYADGMGIVEVKDGENTDTVNDYILLYYPVIVKNGKRAVRVEVWDKEQTTYYIQTGNSLALDKNVPVNPCPHILYRVGSEYYYEEIGRLPFKRLDNNRYRHSDVKQIKPIIDDYDLMDCGLSNNLQDIAEGIYVVKGFKGQSTDELMWNVKSRKVVGVSDKGDLDIRTINIPYEARKAKMDIDEKNIYRTALAFNAAQTGDGNITNIVLKSRYTLLDMKSQRLITRLKKFLMTPLEIAIEEINERYGTAYEAEDVDIVIEPVVPTNDKENAEIKKMEAETKQITVNTVLDAAAAVDEESIIRGLCEIMEWDSTEVLKRKKEADELAAVREALNEEISEGSETVPAGTGRKYQEEAD